MLPLPWLFGLLILNSSCFGPKTESQVATAIQTLMANLIEGSFPSLGASGGSAVDCSVSGSFLATDPVYGSIDPLNPTQLEVSTPIVFDNCVIKVCGTTLSLNGSGTSISISLGDLTGITGASSNSASIQVAFENQAMTGVISGTLNFSYKMTTTLSESTLSSIVIEDNNPAEPLTYQGKTYYGNELDALADGC